MEKSDKELEANGVLSSDNSVTDATIDIPIAGNCPKSVIRSTFRPLAIVGKLFGLFPGYNLSLREDLSDRHIKCIHIFGLAYSGLMLTAMTGGAFLCYYHRPANLQEMLNDNIVDSVVLLTSFYLLLVMGILSLFVFPRQNSRVLRYIDHFANVDKILCFTEKHQLDEKCFARKTLFHLAVAVIGPGTVFSGMFIWVKPELEKSATDYIMVPLAVVATMLHVIPTSIFVFFMNGIRARLALFNEKMNTLILPITPSCFSCEDFEGFGDELNGLVCPRLSRTLTQDLDKMRVLHQEISSLTDETSLIFGTHIIREFLYCIISIICYTYFVFYLLTDEPDYMYIYPFLDLFLFGKLHYISTYANLVTVESSSSLNILNKVCFLKLSPECSIQVEAFIKKLEKPNTITAAGYFAVNRTIISPIFGAIVTYFIILLQLKLGDTKTAFKQMGNCTECLSSTATKLFIQSSSVY